MREKIYFSVGYGVWLFVSCWDYYLLWYSLWFVGIFLYLVWINLDVFEILLKFILNWWFVVWVGWLFIKKSIIVVY